MRFLIIAFLAASTAMASVARAQVLVNPSRPPQVLLSASPLPSDTADTSVLARIRDEGLKRSKVMETAIQLSDVYGPRLAGSPEYRAAAEWARGQLASYGLANARLDQWGRRTGASWRVERHSLELRGPRYQRLVAYPKAWSPPVSGVVRGRPVLVEIRADSDLVKYRGQLRGKIVLNGKPQPSQPSFEPTAHRFSGNELDSLSRLTAPGDPVDYWDDVSGYADRVAARNRLYEQLRAEGVAVLLEPSRNPTAVLISGYQAYGSDVSRTVPTMIVARGDYDRIVHLVQRELPVDLEVSMSTRVVPDDGMGINIVAELPGTDPAVRDEVVLVGGHFDSWTAATGATDNAAGVAVAMEAMRLLVMTGAKPRRTIRIALWDGEEHEEYWGSRGYVVKYLGDPATMRLLPEQARTSAYFNIDNGTGRIRGLYLQGNASARAFFAPMFAPFADLGASTLTIKKVGSTDHMPFVGIGVPAFTFIQDPIDYESRTHHTNLDMAQALLEPDLRQAAVVTAGIILQTANAPTLVPRTPLPGPRK